MFPIREGGPIKSKTRYKLTDIKSREKEETYEQES